MTTMPARNLAARLEQRNASRLLDMKIPHVLDISSEGFNEYRETSLVEKL